MSEIHSPRVADSSRWSTVRLGEIAYARSGDKGSAANVGVIARTASGYEVLRSQLSAESVAEYFRPLGVGHVTRYELANLGALNFVLSGVLAGGGSRNLRIDAQGKTLGQALLEMRVRVPDDILRDCGADRKSDA